MAPTGINPVKDVKPFKSGWQIHVKVVHYWRQHTKYGGESLEMILADETGNKIHASCKEGLVSFVQREFPVNEWRIMKTFNVGEVTGHYRTTAHPYKVVITRETKFVKSDCKMDNPFLSLTSFTSITKGELDTDFLIDVFGQVVDVSEMQTVQVSGEERKKCEFYLRDTSDQKIACCLWGRFAEKIRESCQDSDERVILCLIRFAKITTYRGDLQVTNSFDASDLQINPTIPESEEYMKLLTKDELALTTTVLDIAKKKFKRRKREIWLTYPVKTVGDLKNATETEKCRVTGTIYGNDTDWAWFYFGCCSCTKKVTRTNNEVVLGGAAKPLWRCDTCHENVSKVEPKFKLHLLVKDSSNETKMMLLDTEAQKVVGCKAEKLWDGSYNEIDDPELLPEEIVGVVGKTFHFGVQINKDNVSYGAQTFKISKVWTLEEITKLEVEAAEAEAAEAEAVKDEIQEEHDELKSVSSAISSDKVSTQCEISDTSYGLSTPSSKRKEEVDALPDINSTTKKQCTKLIKLEKDDSK